MKANSKGIWIGLVGLLVLFLVIGGGMYAMSNAPKPPAPTPTPTLAPTTVPTLGPIVVHGLGGPVILKDPEIVAILAQPSTSKTGVELPPVIPQVEDVSTSVMLNWGADSKTGKPADYTGIDYIWFGDLYYANQFKLVKVLSSKTAFTTKLMLYSWWRYEEPLAKAGFVVEQDGYFIMPDDKAAIVLTAQDEGKSWRDIGVDMDGLIDFNGSSYGSSTGIEQMAWMANCFANNCTRPVDIANLDPVLPKLISYVRQQGSQGSSSLRSFGDFISNGEGTMFFIGYDSAFVSWAKENGWSDELIKTVSTKPLKNEPNRLVGIYLGGGTSAQHTYAALTENGKILLEKLNDPRIREIAWAKLGMSTDAIFTKQPPISWMSVSVPVGDKPRDEAYKAILAGLDKEFVK
jgi:hypothetical protein